MAVSYFLFNPLSFTVHNRKKSTVMGAVGQQLMHGNMSSEKSTEKVNFTGFLADLESDINDTRKELNFMKNEVKIL